jgi:hypothetical protein
VAAQDVEGLDGTLQEFVWVGGYDTQMIAKLDGVTGEVLLVTPAPARTYGFALDGLGNLWISTRDSNRIGRVDTTRCVDAASCAGAVCDGEGAGDDCIKQTIAAPHLPYGITVDFNQRVWIGGSSGSSPRVPRFARYDPAAAAGSRWITVPVPLGTHVINGIAADAEGWVWGAGHTGGGVVRIEADNPTNWASVTGTIGHSCKGMAVDADGKIWAITQSDRAIVITPGVGIDEYSVDLEVARSIVTPYTYSDMTGLQLRLATNPRGYYRHVFEGCDDASSTGTDWGDLRFNAETPAGTDVTFRVKTADTREALDAADFILIATVPPDLSPISIRDAFLAMGITPGRFLMVEIGLRAERSSSTEVITPRVLGVDVTHTCPPLIE